MLRDAIKAERELQPEARNISQRLKASEAALSATRRSFRDFMLRAAAVHDQEALSKAALEEEALEATALRHLNEIELALSDRDALDDLLEERRVNYFEDEVLIGRGAVIALCLRHELRLNARHVFTQVRVH